MFTSMKAIVMKGPGGPDVLALQDLPEPTLTRETDLLVRLKAAGVNPVDTKMRAKPTAYSAPLPPVLGCDGAGTVEATGAAVDDFECGDDVFFCQAPVGDRFGTYAEYVLVDQRLAAKKPERLTFEQAAAVPLVLITAWEALHDRAGIRTDQHVLVHGGAGGVGHVAIQVARLASARVSTTLGSRGNAEFVEALGASHLIFYKEQDFVPAALEWTDGRGADVALDTVGGGTLARTFAAVRQYGDVVTLLAASPEIDWSVPRERNQRLSFELMLVPVFRRLLDAMQHQGEILRRGADLLETGDLSVHVDAVLPLARAAEAHARLAGGGTKGKIVLAID